jgi:hypothetical protein
MICRNDSLFRTFAVFAAAAAIGIAGCGRQGAKQSVDEVLRESGKSRADVYPLGGKITIDSQTPEAGGFGQKRIIVMLFDQAKLDAPASGVPKAFCDSKGDFAFSTYDQGDGVAPGKYVLALVELKFDKRKGYYGADGLKNLYNDPVANAQISELTIDHRPPGKKDYAFDLKLAGREAGTPGPKAVTSIRK